MGRNVTHVADSVTFLASVLSIGDVTCVVRVATFLENVKAMVKMMFATAGEQSALPLHFFNPTSALGCDAFYYVVAGIALFQFQTISFLKAVVRLSGLVMLSVSRSVFRPELTGVAVLNRV